MVSDKLASRRGERAFLHAELAVAMALLVTIVLPLGGAWLHQKKLLRAYYEDAVAMEILDGEMEILAAGQWREFNEGQHEIQPTALAAKNLPRGKFTLTRESQRVRLEWIPEKGRRMSREVRL